MLFTAPAFVFLFLPLSMFFYLLFGKNNKKRCLLIICGLYHLFLNMAHPLNLIWLPLIAIYAFFAQKTVQMCRRRWLTVILCAVPVIWLVMIRSMVYLGIDGFKYPVGITVPVLAAVSYIMDSLDAERGIDDILRVLLYIGFFPVMLLGPFIRYRDFCELTEENEISVSLSGVADGLKLFALGFIKRIAIGAVLIDGYQRIFAYSWEAHSFGVILVLLMLVYFGVFFSVSGYYDMGVGVANMFGIRIQPVVANPFTVATVNEYSKTLFGSVRMWTESYVLCPIRAIRKKNESRTVKVITYCLCIFLLVRSEFAMLVFTIPLIAFSLLSAALRLDKRSGKSRTGLRWLFGMLNVLVLGAFWVFVTMGGENSVLQYIKDITVNNAEYQTDMVLVTFSGAKYLFVTLMAIGVVLPHMGWVRRGYAGAESRTRAVVDYGALFALLALFIFAVIFFLPQFPEYNTNPFNYLII